MDNFPISSLRVALKTADLGQMLKLLKISWKLLNSPAYRQQIAADLPESARFCPGNAAVMMGYDFHLSDQGPRLIEINTNAGGAGLALRACRGEPQPTPSLQRRLLQMFQGEWQAFRPGRPLQTVAIIDEHPQEQWLYPEMKRFGQWLGREGISVVIADPSQLEINRAGVFSAGQPIDLIYNRHCDFYLETPEMAQIQRAYLQRQVCLTPNPFVYGHLADKRRQNLWRNPVAMHAAGLKAAEIEVLQQMLPESYLLAELGIDRAWDMRKDLVFKPVDRFGSKGVFVGKSISRKRFNELEPQLTIAQQLVLPSQLKDAASQSYKADLRLFAWRNHALGVAARLYQGQVTNLNTEGGGFAAVDLV